MEPHEPTPTHSDGEAVDEVREASGEAAGAGSESSGWTTTKQAAKALGVSRRMVQEYVRRGELEALVDGKGVNKTYYVSIDSLNLLRERRASEAKDAKKFADASSGTGLAAKHTEELGESAGEVLRRTIERLETRTAEAADLRARLELTQETESSLREQLERERGRADRLEEELGRARRGWLRRFFGI